MTSQPSVRRRLTRLEHEVESLYELIDEFHNTFDDFGVSFTAFKSQARIRFDRIDERLEQVEAGIAELLRRPDAS